MGAGTKIVVKSLTNQDTTTTEWSGCDDWKSFIESIQAAGHDGIVLVANAQGVTDGSQVIVIDAGKEDEAADRSAIYFQNTGSTSVTIGGDFSTMSNVKRIYNVYYEGTFNGGTGKVSLIHAGGDLHLTLTTATGAATAYKVETVIRGTNKLYEGDNSTLDESGLPVYTSVAVSNKTMFTGNLTLETNTVLTGDLELAGLEVADIASDTTLPVDTFLYAGSILAAESVLTTTDAEALRKAGAQFEDDNMTLKESWTLTENRTLQAGTLLKSGSQVAAVAELKQDTKLENTATLYAGSVLAAGSVLTTTDAEVLKKAGAQFEDDNVTLKESWTLTGDQEFQKDTLLKSGSQLTSKADSLVNVVLQGHLLAEDTTLAVETTLNSGSILKAGSVFSADDAGKLAGAYFAELSGDRRILLSDFTYTGTESLTLSKGAVLKAQSSILSDIPVLKEDICTENKTLTSKVTVYKGSIINGVTLEEDTTYGVGFIIKAGSTVRTEAKVGILLSGTTVLLKGTVLQKGQRTPDGAILTEEKTLDEDTTFEVKEGGEQIVLLNGTKLAAGTVLRAGTMLEKGTVLSKNSAIAAGTVSTENHKELAETVLATDWSLSTDITLTGKMTLAAPVSLGG